MKNAWRYFTTLWGAGMVLLILLAPKEVQAVDCDGTNLVCLTAGKSGWEHFGTDTKAKINIANIVWEDNPSSYPIKSKNDLEIIFTKNIAFTYPFGGKGAYKNLSLSFIPTSDLIYNASKKGFTIKGKTDKLILKFKFKLELLGPSFKNPSPGEPNGKLSGTASAESTATITELTMVKNDYQTHKARLTLYVAAEALDGIPKDKIELSETKIFDIRFSGTGNANVGSVWIDGSSSVTPPTPPKPKTCTVWTNKEYRTIDLGRHTTGEFEAVAVGGELGNGTHTDALVLKACPENLTVGLRLDEAPGLPAGVTTDPGKVYLVNRHNNAAERAGGGGA